MKVEFLACRPKNHPFPILSWAIRYFQKTNYSHNAIKVGNIVYDATGKDVRINASWEFNKRYETVESIEIDTDLEFNTLVNWMLIYIGRSYGFFQLVGIALRMLGFVKSNPFGRGDKILICSELLILFLAEFSGFEPGDTDEYDLVSTWEISKKYKVDYGDDAGYIG